MQRSLYQNKRYSKQRKNKNKQQDKQNKFTYKQLQEPEQFPAPKKLRRSGETEKQIGKRPASENETLLNTTPQPREAKQDHKRIQQKTTIKTTRKTNARANTTDNQESIQDKLFTIITNKAVTMLKYKGSRALDELVGLNKGEIRLISRRRTRKESATDQIFRAERVSIIHEMTTEEARTTEVSTTGTARGRYGNAHIRYDVNDGLVDVILEVIPTEEQKSERARDQKKQKEKKDKRNMTKEEEHEIKEKYWPRSDEDA
jgi:hypothetical protein